MLVSAPRPVSLPARVEPVSRLNTIYMVNQDEAQADDLRLMRRYQDRAEFSRAALRLLEQEEAQARGATTASVTSRNQG